MRRVGWFTWACSAAGVLLATGTEAAAQDNPYDGKINLYQGALFKAGPKPAAEKPLNEKLTARLEEVQTEMKALQRRGAEEPALGLRGKLLRHIYVTEGKGAAEIGLLRRAGNISWPAALRGKELAPDRKQFEQLLRRAVVQARRGKVDAKVLQAVTAARDRIQEDLVKQVNEVPVSNYLEAKRFLLRVRDATQALADPQSRADLAACEELPSKGKTVPSLVRYMAARGVRFAPPAPGDEMYYEQLDRVFGEWIREARAAPAKK
jgi:hypothetical protein